MKKIFAVICAFVFSMGVFGVAKADAWDNAPRFDNQFDLVAYLKNEALELRPVVHAVLTNGYEINTSDVLFLANLHSMSTNIEPTDDPQTKRVTFNINYPHGERIAYAYLHNDTSNLSSEDMQIYNEAVQIVNEANNFAAGHSNPDLYRELYIHDAITARTTYYTETPMLPNSRYLSAVGVFIDGKANCNGYADSFYMLGKMCGLKVQKINANNYDYSVSHVFNIITLNGKNYFVDVTADDAEIPSTTGVENNYIYFNTSADIVAASYQWSREYYPTVVESPDENFYYYTDEFYRSGEQYFGGHASTAEEALDLVAEQFSKGRRIARVFAPENDTYKDQNTAMRYVLDQLPQKYGWHGSISMQISWRAGKYMFFTSEGKRSN